MSSSEGSTPVAAMSAAEKRAEARRRRLAQADDRLARIKALQTGEELPPLSEVPVSDAALAAAAAKVDVPAPAPVPVAAAAPKPVAAALAPAAAAPVQRSVPAVAAAAPTTAATVRARKSAAPTRSTPTPATATPFMSPQERAVLAQLQERAYAASTRRWRAIHTVVSIVLGVALFFYVLWAAAELHVDGEEVMGMLLHGYDDDMRIPAMSVFSIFLGAEAALYGARYLLDKPSFSPPTNDLLSQVGLGMGMPAAGGVAGIATTVTNLSYTAGCVASDLCHMLVVFGVGIVACAYYAGVVTLPSDDA
ncbi:hypothetical protein H9P43_005931 [Blastocladiella emersonii ATCC 22665]|nr:hypothetical protein H9P43_005931 [Blastocladiella emersonii ATCC 22665]